MIRSGKAQWSRPAVCHILSPNAPTTPWLKCGDFARSEAPLSDLARWPHFVKRLHELEEENPEIVKFMKRYASDRFLDCGVVIGSFPQGGSGPVVYGYFVVDRTEAHKANSTSRIKQDFVVWDPRSKKADYYSGRPKSEPGNPSVKTIGAFCAQFGNGGEYGCHKSGHTWICRDHHYIDENDPRLPIESAIRRAVSSAMRSVRNE